jgi:hypothetical protein
MDIVAKAGPTRAGEGMAAADILSRDARRAGSSQEHRCALPGYLQLRDLTMFWQCQDCGETWQVLADRRSQDAPLEFVWARDPIQPANSQAP